MERRRPVTRIDFHSNAPNKPGYACRLAREAYAAGSRLVIFSADNAVLTSLDQLLWTFSALDFLPHCRAGDSLAAETPIILASSASGLPHHQLLISLDEVQPDFFSRFDRLIEIVGTDEEDIAAGRRRWKFYKDRGYPLTHHDARQSEPSGARP